MVDWKKPIQTKDGQAARLLGVLNDNRRTHIVAIDSGIGDGEYVRLLNEHGEVVGYADHTDCIVNAPVRRTVYVNFYDMGPDCPPLASVHTTRELAEGVSGGSYEKVACVEVAYTEGEGLE